MWMFSKTKLFWVRLGAASSDSTNAPRKLGNTQEDNCQTTSRCREWLLLQCSAKRVIFVIALVFLLCHVMSSKKAAGFIFL